jgi:arylsulfatase A-like enzyme
MTNQTRRDFIRTTALASAASFLPLTGCQQHKRRPNIVLIMADDVGREVLGCYGGTSYETPNLDRLAETGVRFTHAYSSAKCSPSRVKIMTGRYQFRTTEEWGKIPPDERTFGHVLSAAGYATAVAGKWQMALLKDDPTHVQKMGFEESCVFGWHEGPRYHQPLIYQNDTIRDDVKDKYGPDVYLDFLIDFMEKNAEKGIPFIAYYPMAIAHTVSNDFWPPPPPGPDGRYQTYAELIAYMDKLIGRLVQALDSMGERENTLILYTTDNGSPRDFITEIRDRQYIKTPIVSKMGEKTVIGGKGLLTDAGCRVPFIAYWPGTAPEGRICDDLVDFTDILPTLAELAGADLPGGVVIDGQSIVPQLKGKPGHLRDWVYNQFEGEAWIRSKEWKLYKDGRLFDMVNDTDENNPIFAGADTESSALMRRRLKGYFQDVYSRMAE